MRLTPYRSHYCFGYVVLLPVLFTTMSPPGGMAVGSSIVRKDLTCWTCPNKTTNDDCNMWAPDRPCYKNHTICKTIHQLHATKGHSIAVHKVCAPEHECTKDDVGCRLTGNDNIQECISCCTHSYCNEFVPTNMSSAIALSTIDLGLSNAATRTASNRFPLLVVAIVAEVFSYDRR